MIAICNIQCLPLARNRRVLKRVKHALYDVKIENHEIQIANL